MEYPGGPRGGESASHFKPPPAVVRAVEERQVSMAGIWAALWAWGAIKQEEWMRLGSVGKVSRLPIVSVSV